MHDTQAHGYGPAVTIAQVFMSLSLSIAVLGEVILPGTSLQIKTIAVKNWPDRAPGGKK